MRLRKAVSPLLATIILLTLVIAGSIVVYSILSALTDGLGSVLAVQIVSVDLIRSGDRALFSVSVKNTGNKPVTGIIVSGLDDNGRSFKLALPASSPGGESGNALLIPLGQPNQVLDCSGKNNHGTVYGGATWVDGVYGKALSFDGIDDYIQVADSDSLDLTDKVTVEMWVKPDAFGRTRELGSKVGGWGQDFYVFSTGALEWQLKLDDGSYWSIVSSTPVSVGNWCDLAFAVDTSTDRAWIYINGVQDAYVNAFPSERIINRSNNPFYIGIWHGELMYAFDGIFDEVRVYNGSLSDGEYAWNYNHPGYPVTNGLVLWLPLDEGSSSPFSFIIGNSYPVTITAYSLDGSLFTKALTVKCST